MWQRSRQIGRTAIVLFVTTAALRADGFFTQFWPELESYIRVTENSRALLLYSQTREDQQGNTDDQLGAGMDFFFAPLIKNREYAHPDIARNRFPHGTPGLPLR